jgi:hypothetical protein
MVNSSADCGRCELADSSDRSGSDRRHAFLQKLRRGHYELGVDAPPALRVVASFAELAQAI